MVPQSFHRDPMNETPTPDSSVASTAGRGRLPPASPRGRGFSLRSASFVIGAALIVPLALWPWIVQLPPGGIEDDGYFYSQIAYNAGVHGLVSFDGIHRTDGFHLLWGYLLAGVSWLTALFTESKPAHLYVHCAVTVAVLSLCAECFGRSWLDRALLVGIGITGSLPFETPLLALFYLCLMAAVTSRGFEGRTWPLILFPVLVVLTRVDAAPMAVIGAGALWMDRRHRAFLKVLVSVGVGVGLQLLLMKAVGGEWFSVSSALKVGRIGPLELPGLPPYPGRFAVLLALGSVSLAAVVRHLRVQRDHGPLFLWLGVAAFTFPHAVFSVLRPWYYVPAFLVMTVALVWARDADRSRKVISPRVGLGVAGFAVLAFAALEVANSVRYREETGRVRAFIDEVRALVPPDEPIFQVDGTGYTGYFSQRRIINGDGLVNTHEYARRLRANELTSYLDEEEISYIITNRRRRDPVVDVGGLVVEPSEVEELARKTGESVNRFTNFVLYRRVPGPSESGRVR